MPIPMPMYQHQRLTDDLAMAAQQGDRQAADRLWLELKPIAWPNVRRLQWAIKMPLPDAWQEAGLSLAATLQRWQPGRAPVAVTFAHRWALDARSLVRNARRQRRQSPSLYTIGDLHPPAALADPTAAATRADELDALAARAAELPPAQRECVAAYIAIGRTGQTVTAATLAQAMGTPQRTAVNRLVAARASLGVPLLSIA